MSKGEGFSVAGKTADETLPNWDQHLKERIGLNANDGVTQCFIEILNDHDQLA